MDVFTELLPMQKTRKRPKIGDVFVVQPLRDRYYFGKVLETNIQGTNVMFEGMVLICLYDHVSEDRMLPESLDAYPLRISPTVVNYQGWLKGYFETVGNIPLSEREKNLDYGFYEREDPVELIEEEIPKRTTYIDLHGNPLNRVPQYSSSTGLYSYGFVGRVLHGSVEHNPFTNSE